MQEALRFIFNGKYDDPIIQAVKIRRFGIARKMLSFLDDRCKTAGMLPEIKPYMISHCTKITWSLFQHCIPKLEIDDYIDVWGNILTRQPLNARVVKAVLPLGQVLDPEILKDLAGRKRGELIASLVGMLKIALHYQYDGLLLASLEMLRTVLNTEDRLSQLIPQYETSKLETHRVS